MDPTQKERNSKLTASLIVYVDNELGLDTPKNIIAAANDFYGQGEKLSVMVPMLCSKLTAMSDELRDIVIYNGRNPIARELAQWWEEHQAADAKRLREEKEMKEREKLRDAAIAKLTPEERQALGL